MLVKGLRTGITTGTCAAAAAKAAVLAWSGLQPQTVEVDSPQGKAISVPIAKFEVNSEGGRAAVIKDAGDDPDITHGITIIATVALNASADIIIKAGPGVGTVTKPGLAVAVGRTAVNPGPRKMIVEALLKVLPADCGAVVTISIPEGEDGRSGPLIRRWGSSADFRLSVPPGSWNRCPRRPLKPH